MIVVFLGPTLCHDEARRELDATFLQPVAQGDVYRATLLRPAAIGIVDGYFSRVPSVWHKEILWALSQGIRVYGSASMGALRASELDAFGMVGVGSIYEAYRDGMLEDDDEVALAHGDQADGYIALSEPMVNIRATLALAEAEGVVTPQGRAAMEAVAKDLFYPERSFELLIRTAVDHGVPPDEVQALECWLPGRRVDQKRQDALEMLRRMRADIALGPAPRAASFEFERTGLWEELTQAAGELELTGEVSAASQTLDRALSALRADPQAYRSVRDAATARVLAAYESQHQGLEVNEDLLYETVVDFRRERNLLEPEDLLRWMTANGLTQAGYLRLMDGEARLRWLQAVLADDIEVAMLEHLRLSGQYAEDPAGPR